MDCSSTFTNPLQGVALGDPYVLRWRGRFYLYGTNDGPPLPEGRQIPVYSSEDLIHWQPLGGALIPQDPTADHWAPEVLAWNGRFYMVVSFGDVDRRGHQLWVAVAERPEGPFELSRRVSDPSEVFSIDGSWLLDDDGRLYLFRCLDFVEESDPPFGTGIVAQAMRDPLTPSGPPVTVLRAHAPWQLFLANRTMPLYGGRTFAEWNTIEGPCPVKRGRRYYCGYSGGNYTGAYGTGEAVAEAPLGPYVDLTGAHGPIFGTIPGLVEGPGHFSVVRPDGMHEWIVLHGRTPGESVRRVWLCPAKWDERGVDVGRLTIEAQPAPPLPQELWRFGEYRAVPRQWALEGQGWRTDSDGLVHEGATGVAWRDSGLARDWLVEAYVKFSERDTVAAGLIIRAGDRVTRVEVRPAGVPRCVATGFDGPSQSTAAPTLGAEPFDASVFHCIEIRASHGWAEVRLDGVVIRPKVAVAEPAELGLFASGVATFDAVAITPGR